MAVRGAVSVLLFMVCLSGCSAVTPDDPASARLMEATENGTLEERAQEDCTTYVSGLPLAAAMDADAGTVRRLVADLGTRGDWETGLPVDEDEYVAICVYDVGSVDGLVDDPSFMAYWVTAQASREFVAWG